ncbi:7208_t:CDS:2 [Rhizophagus irregularis]|nr:7208_t:CDS:2 [Rhizophagus irregularis]
MLIINKVKILAPLNGASEEKIGEALNNQQNLCSKNPNESENSPAKYYQLTVSDEMEEILNNTEIKYNLFIRNPIADDVNQIIFPIQEAGGIRSNYYAVNIITGESYLDYTWNGSFRDVCKHVHAVLTYFKDKQRVLPSSNKNLLIYNGSVAYQEIIRLYNLQDICPFCDEILPNPMPYKTKLVLDQLNKIKE